MSWPAASAGPTSSSQTSTQSSSITSPSESSGKQDSVQNLCNKSTVQTSSSNVSPTSNRNCIKYGARTRKTSTLDDFGFAALSKIDSVVSDKPINLVTSGSSSKSAEGFPTDSPSTCSSAKYRSAHPIGSRKVTENVITYHEPMFQSVANNLFEQKKLAMGKRKADECGQEGASVSPEQKKAKFNSGETSIPAISEVVKTIKRKKPRIESVINRLLSVKSASSGVNLTTGDGRTPQTSAIANVTSVQSTTNSAAEAGTKLNVDVKTEKNCPVPIQSQPSTVHNQKESTTHSKLITPALCKQEPIHDLSKPTNKTDSKKVPTSKDKTTCVQNKKAEVQNVVKCTSASVKKEAIQEVHQSESESLQTEKRARKKCAIVEKGSKSETCVSSNETSKPTSKRKNTERSESRVSSTDSEKSKTEKSTTRKLTKSAGDKNTERSESRVSSTDSEKSKTEKSTTRKLTKSAGDNAKQKQSNDETKQKQSKKTAKAAEQSEKGNSKQNLKGKKKTDGSSDDGDTTDESTGKNSKKSVKSGKGDADSEDKGAAKSKNNAGGKASSKTDVKPNANKAKKAKPPIPCRRAKREASLNAATLVNILYESPVAPKLSSKRSKSESDMKLTPVKRTMSSSSSVSDVKPSDSSTTSSLDDNLFNKANKVKLDGSYSSTSLGDKFAVPKASLSPKKEKTAKVATGGSPKRKVSFSEGTLDSVFADVIQRSNNEIDKKSVKGTQNKRTKASPSNKSKPEKKPQTKVTKKEAKKAAKESAKKQTKFKSEKKEKKFRLKNIKKAIKLTAAKSPEEMADKKRKASLARLERAKEILITAKKTVSDEFSSEDSQDSQDTRCSDDSESVSSDSVEVDSEVSKQSEKEVDSDDTKHMKAKKGALFRSARTHVSVESKTVVENAMPSPRWCECCQSTYYPSQPQGAQVWRIKHLVDKGSSKSPEPIQTSSHHFIAAHASCEVRPYASPSHVSVLESTPYVGAIVPHGHIQCCGHTGGMFHPASCQNCTLGSVGNLMSCQRYSNTYSVTYPHSHGSYTHCGCGSCYSGNTYHHTMGQALIHQPQMPISTDSPILLHHPVQLQVTHETSHPVSMPSLAHSHADASSLQHSAYSDPGSLSHPVQMQLSHSSEQPVPPGVARQLSQGDKSQSHLARMCQLSQGELTNVSVLASNSDQEIVDVGSQDDFIKSVPTSLTQTLLNNENTSSKSSVSSVDSDSSDVTVVPGMITKKKSRPSVDTDTKKSAKQKQETDTKKLSEEKRHELLLMRRRERYHQRKMKERSLSQPADKGTKADGSEDGYGSARAAQSKVRANSCDSKKSKQDTASNTAKASKSTTNSRKKSNDDSAKKQAAEVEEEQPKMSTHGWSWHGDPLMKNIINIFDGQAVMRKCFKGIIHEDGDEIQVKDCVLVCSGRKENDIPYVAKVTNFWEESTSGEMMMSVLWYYRPEHSDGGRRHEHIENEVFAAKHRDETLVACIEDRGYVLTFNEYCRFKAEVERVKCNLPPRSSAVPEPEEVYPRYRIPPLDVDPETVFLCRQVYDVKLKRVLKNPS